jgi:hypothetical protein
VDAHLGVFISHDRAHRPALLPKQCGDHSPYLADAARRAGTRVEVAMCFPPAVLDAVVDHKSTISVALRRDVLPVATDAAHIR